MLLPRSYRPEWSEVRAPRAVSAHRWWHSRAPADQPHCPENLQPNDLPKALLQRLAKRVYRKEWKTVLAFSYRFLLHAKAHPEKCEAVFGKDAGHKMLRAPIVRPPPRQLLLAFPLSANAHALAYHTIDLMQSPHRNSD